MTEKEITCIVCPIGCKIIVKSNKKKVDIIDGHKCKKGIEYATHEALDPRRMLATSVLVNGGKWPLVSVKTSKPISKEKIWDVLTQIKKKRISAPVKSGTIVIKNVAGTDIDVIATKSVNKKTKN
jgi:CxxC motif-containing protein